ncbi:hypothetical protein [Spirosoma jeollabukense]
MPEEYDLPEPVDDFSLLTIDELRAIKTNHIELKSIRNSAMAVWIPISGYPPADCFYYVIGCSSNSRFLLVVLNYDSERGRYFYHQVKVADEQEIKRLWCG